MARSSSRLVAGFFLIVGCAVPIIGCDGKQVLDSLGYTFLPELPFTPSGAAAVRDGAERFARNESDPLLTIAPGTPKDDLARLDGCWGSYEVFRLPTGGSVINADFYRFDVANKQAVFQRLQIAPIGGADVPSFEAGVETVYQFEIAGPDHIRWTSVVSSRVSTNLANRDGTFPTDVQGVVDQPLAEEFFTVDGDKMITNKEDLVSLFRRMDCPPE